MGLLERAARNAFVLWHLREERRLPYWSESRLRERQDRRVREIVRFAYDSVPYYREVMDDRGLRPSTFESAQDLSRLPILEREELARDPARFRSRATRSAGGVELRTTGTSGHSKSVLYDASAAFLALAHGHRQRSACQALLGGPAVRREVQVDRRGGVSDRLRGFYEAHSWVPPRMDLERLSIQHTDSFEENIARINSFRPDAIGGVGSYIGAIYRYASEKRLPVHRPRVVRYGGDAIPEADRQHLEDELGVPVFSTYQAVEALRIGYQCERREGLHLHVDSVAVRTVDGDDRPLQSGQPGDLILSNLVNRGTVILNYRLGDVASMEARPCPCGRTLPTIARLEGRSGDLLRLPSGQAMYANSVVAAAGVVAGFVQAQLVQESLRRFTLRVVLDPSAEWKLAHAHLDSVLREVLGEGADLSIERCDSIATEPGGKTRAFVCRLAQPED